jgi:hypothetical protein
VSERNSSQSLRFLEAKGHLEPLFRKAVDLASKQGVVAMAASSTDPLGKPALSLEVMPGKGPGGRYLLRAAEQAESVIHEERIGMIESARTSTTSLDALNETVLQARLASFMRKASGLEIGFLAPGERAGF